MTFVTKDSGERQEFDTGSRRDTREGKGRFDLLPFFAIRRLADLYERGAEKYGDRNWEKGQPLTRFADSMLRHAFLAAAGYTDEDHLAAVAWNALGIIDHQERIARGDLPEELDDLPVPTYNSPDDKPEDVNPFQLTFPVHEQPLVYIPPVLPSPTPPVQPSWWQQQIISGGGDYTLTNVNTGEDRPYSPRHTDDHAGHNHD